MGVSHQTIAKWRSGRVGELQPATRRLLISYLESSEEPPGSKAAPRPALNYAGLGIDIPGLDQLRPAARAELDRALYAVLGRGANIEEVQRAGRMLVSPIVEGRVGDEEAQLAMLRALAPVATSGAAVAERVRDGWSRLQHAEELRGQPGEAESESDLPPRGTGTDRG